MAGNTHKKAGVDERAYIPIRQWPLGQARLVESDAIESVSGWAGHGAVPML
jgi:hypothetical protein